MQILHTPIFDRFCHIVHCKLRLSKLKFIAVCSLENGLRGYDDVIIDSQCMSARALTLLRIKNHYYSNEYATAQSNAVNVDRSIEATHINLGLAICRPRTYNWPMKDTENWSQIRSRGQGLEPGLYWWGVSGYKADLFSSVVRRMYADISIKRL